MTLPEQANRRILFVDMNSFFASCEQADRPELQGKPIIVVPTEGSCALSASYEAKAFDIKTGTSAKEARFLCPATIAVKARPKRYMEYHQILVDILHDVSPNITIRSVDEGSIKLCWNEDPWQLGQQIKELIWQKMSPVVHCSIGIGPNVLLAKLATELQKPNGLVEIRLEDLPNIYQTIKLRDLCGINRGIENQLARIGIYSTVELYQASPDFLREKLGVMGYRWWLQLHGYPSYEHHARHKSLSHSHVLPPMQRSPEAAYVTLQHLTAKVGRRLRRDGYVAGSLALSIRYADHQWVGQHLRVTPINDTLTLLDHIDRLWHQLNPRQPILKLAVWTHNLQLADSIPQPLFPEDQKRQRLARALDRINDRHGSNTIHFAVLDTDGSRAPDRIAFSSLYQIEHE